MFVFTHQAPLHQAHSPPPELLPDSSNPKGRLLSSLSTRNDISAIFSREISHLLIHRRLISFFPFPVHRIILNHFLWIHSLIPLSLLLSYHPSDNHFPAVSTISDNSFTFRKRHPYPSSSQEHWPLNFPRRTAARSRSHVPPDSSSHFDTTKKGPIS